MLSRTYFVVLSSLLLTSLIGIGCGSVHSNLKASQQIEVFRLKLSKAALNAFRTTPPPKSFNLEDFSKPTDENIAKGTATANVQIDISPLRTRNTDVKSAIDAAGLRIDLNNTITLRLRANYSVNARYDIYNNKRGGQHARIGSVYNHEFNGQVDTLIFLKGSGPIDRRIVKAIPIATGETNPDTFSYRAHFAQVRTGSRFANFGRWVAGDRIARRIANDSIPNDAPETFKKQVPPAVAEEVATQIDEYLKSGNNGFATLLNYLTEKNELPGTMRVSSSPTDAYFSIFMDSDEAQDSIPFKREYRTINQVNNTNGDISVFVHEYLLSSFFQKNVYTRDFVTENYFVNVFTGSAFNKKYTGETGSSGLATLKFNRRKN